MRKEDWELLREEEKNGEVGEEAGIWVDYLRTRA